MAHTDGERHPQAHRTACDPARARIDLGCRARRTRWSVAILVGRRGTSLTRSQCASLAR